MSEAFPPVKKKPRNVRGRCRILRTGNVQAPTSGGYAMMVMLPGLFGEPGTSVGASTAGVQLEDGVAAAPRNISLIGRVLKKYRHQPPSSATNPQKNAFPKRTAGIRGSSGG